MSTFTENYQLHQWVPEDNFLRTDFNEDNAIIDAALGAKCEMVYGTYTGDNAESRTISLGFTPKAVFLFTDEGETNCQGTVYGGLFLPGHPLFTVNSSTHITAAEIVDGGFGVYFNASASSYTNHYMCTYYYLALK